jgi:hypothetical protein
MKKIILWGIIASSFLFLVSETTNAISYGSPSNTTYGLPDMNFSISGTPYLISPKTGFQKSALWSFYSNGSYPYHVVQSGFSCFRYSNSSTN